MENQTSFDLNLAIERWRENLAQSSAFKCENLNELESHLRDSVGKLEASGLSAEEAFLIASQRIGGTERLEVEFGKLNVKMVWMDRLLWMLVGVMTWKFVIPLSGIPASLIALGWTTPRYHWTVRLTLPIVMFAIVRVLSLGASFGLLWWLIFKRGNKFGQWFLSKLQRRYSVVGFAIIACLLLFLLQVMSAGYLNWRFRSATAIETSEYLNVSQTFVRLALTLGLIVFTLSLARKRALLKRA